MANEYGLDVRYFKEKLGLLIRDADRHTPSEMTRALRIYSKVARDQISEKDPEFIKEEAPEPTPILIKPQVEGTVYDEDGREIKTVKASKVEVYEGGFKASFDDPLEGRFFRVKYNY